MTWIPCSRCHDAFCKCAATPFRPEPKPYLQTFIEQSIAEALTRNRARIAARLRVAAEQFGNGAGAAVLEAVANAVESGGDER